MPPVDWIEHFYVHAHPIARRGDGRPMGMRTTDPAMPQPDHLVALHVAVQHVRLCINFYHIRIPEAAGPTAFPA